MTETFGNERIIYRFGRFEIDVSNRLLRHDGKILQLTPKIFDTLLLLVENNGQTLSKEEIMEAVWADTFVEESNLTSNISRLRKILQIDGAQYIETFSKRGYCFRAEVERKVKEIEIRTTRRIKARVVQTVEKDQFDLPDAEYSRLSETGTNERTIAVLPFLTLGLKTDEKYLGLGLADSLITQLGRQKQLLVRPTSAVKRFADTEQNSIEIGKELRVGTVLEGSLQKTSDRLRLTIQLVNVAQETEIWTEKFIVPLADIFEIQDTLARQIADALLLKLSGEERGQLSKRDTSSGEAFQSYLKGRYFWNKRSIEGFYKAIEYFKAAIDADPTYALAYTGLSDAYSMLPFWGETAPVDSFPRARAAAQRALEIDVNVAEAHAALGYVNCIYDWNFPEAEKCYRRAIELNPNYATARTYYAKFCVMLRRFEDAEIQMKFAEQIDPLSPQVGTSFAALFLYWRRYEDAIRQYEKLLAFEPDFVPALIGLGLAFSGCGKFEEALQAHEKAVRLSGETPIIAGFLACTQALAGKTDLACEFVERFEKESNRSKVLNYSLAGVYACLSDKDKAFHYLERCFEERNNHLPDIDIDPEFDSLRLDSRFEDLRRRIGLA